MDMDVDEFLDNSEWDRDSLARKSMNSRRTNRSNQSNEAKLRGLETIYL